MAERSKQAESIPAIVGTGFLSLDGVVIAIDWVRRGQTVMGIIGSPQWVYLLMFAGLFLRLVWGIRGSGFKEPMQLAASGVEGTLLIV
jgi:hypothetical protein